MEEDEGSSGRPIQIPTPATQRQTCNTAPSPVHRPSGTTDVTPATLNLRPPPRFRPKFLHHPQRDHAPQVHRQYQIIVLHRECLQQRGKGDHNDVPENLVSPPSEEWSLNEQTKKHHTQGAWACGKRLPKTLPLDPITLGKGRPIPPRS